MSLSVVVWLWRGYCVSASYIAVVVMSGAMSHDCFRIFGIAHASDTTPSSEGLAGVSVGKIAAVKEMSSFNFR